MKFIAVFLRRVWNPEYRYTNAIILALFHVLHFILRLCCFVEMQLLQINWKIAYVMRTWKPSSYLYYLCSLYVIGYCTCNWNKSMKHAL